MHTRADADARTLIQEACARANARSLYALAVRLHLPPARVQRWHRTNRVSRVARALLLTVARHGV